MEIDNFSVFEHLLKAPNKDFVSRLILEAFIHRDGMKIPSAVLKTVSEALEIDENTSDKIIKELSVVIKKILFDGLNELSQIQNLFASSSLQANLKNLLSKLLLEKVPHFKKTSIDDEKMFPRLIDFDWRVDIKMASNLTSNDETTKSGQQTCILQLKTEDNEKKTQQDVKLQRTVSLNKPPPILDIYEIIKQQFKKRSEKQLGLLNFFARVYPSDKCGSNGLPLTPNSIRIYGKFQYLKTLKHKNLCRYVDIQRGNHERLFVISEHYSLNLNELLNDTYIYNLIMANTTILYKWVLQLLKSFVYLSNNQVVNRFLHLKYICISKNGNIKLSNYGLYYMSENGFCVNFPITNYVTLAPECLVMEYFYGNKFAEHPTNNQEQNIELSNSKVDVWAFGVILFQFLFGLSSQTESSQQQLNELLLFERIIKKLLDLYANSHVLNDDFDDDGSLGFNYLLDLYQIDEDRKKSIEQRIRPIFIQIIKKCLIINPIKRSDFKSLLKTLSDHISGQNDYKFLIKSKLHPDEMGYESIKWKLFNGCVRSDMLTMNGDHSIHDDNKVDEDDDENEDDHLWKRGVDEVYYLWRLAGGDCFQTIVKTGRLSNKLMAIHKLPVYVRIEDGYEFGKPVNEETKFDESIVPLSLDQLRKRLSSIKLDAYYPVIERDLDIYKREDDNSLQSAQITDLNRKQTILNDNFFRSVSSSSLQQNGNFSNSKIQNSTWDMLETTQKQPLNIREGDIEYQFHRIILFSRYLIAYPFKKQELYKECRLDIPPIYRNLAWAALLDVRHDIGRVYAQINKEIITSTDRQIDVDIPRCHQYDPLMASPQAHYKLKRILKSWVISNSNLVYWQGLDSLCAPFLYLNFNDEAVAFGCLTNFINKYAAKFFLRDNTVVIHEYLAVFSHLIAFHDPELANHFEQIEFKPDLYAIPWFLTMFAHVFPLYKIFHLWDTLLLGSSSYPLCIGVAILKQLRNILLNSDFNECILLFSELPEINIAKCVIDSIEIFCWTPSSCLYREHSQMNKKIPQKVPGVPILDMTPISLDQQREELCPRISARDVLNLFNSKHSKLILIDLRPSSEYSQGFVINSKNIPFDNINMNKLNQLGTSKTVLNNASESDSASFLIYQLQQHKNLVKIIMSSETRFNDAVQLANTLVRFEFNKICILHNGVECFKNTKIFQIQEAEEYANQAPKIEHLNLELTKQTLNTMLDGLTRIKDQLNSVATQ